MMLLLLHGTTFLSYLILANLPGHALAAPPIVDLGYAQYQGVFNGTANITSYLGIRYAAPPLGDLRWRAPQSPAIVSDVQQADKNPDMCLQGAIGVNSTNPLPGSHYNRPSGTGMVKRFVSVNASEDCLFLNVHFPGSDIPTEGLSTVVWIHGGGYDVGWAAQYDGQHLVEASNHRAVVVVIQYRLGVFGFLPGSAVKSDGVLNAGLLDQEFALRWVQQHISQFGGDPTKVTIWGESAGAGSVLQHVVAHDGRTQPPLFRGAMTSSTYLPSQYLYNDTVPEYLYMETVRRTNCSRAVDTLACLRASDVDIISQANVDINTAGFFGTFTFVPVVDGEFITQRVTRALDEGRVNGDVLLSVTNVNEGTIFVDPSFNGTAGDYAQLLYPTISPHQGEEIAKIYNDFESPLGQASAILGESLIICPTYYLLDAFQNRSYKGEFAVPPADHGSDILLYFPDAIPDTPPVYNNTAFITAFSRAFMSFGVSLDPNKKVEPTIAPFWPGWTVKEEREMIWNRTEQGEPDISVARTDKSLLERCDFWRNIAASTAQ